MTKTKHTFTFYNLSKSSLDEVRVYNRVLSADEVGDLYRLGQEKIIAINLTCQI